MKPRIRQYPHFDPPLSKKAAEVLVATPDSVCRHTFYPFLEYKQRWTKFAPVGQKGAVKERPIRYAARRDSYIFSHYREQLQAKYEIQLSQLKISDSILAYRRIPTGKGAGNKCNIHFAKDAFERVIQLGDCYAYALDISKFFESLDHGKIKQSWTELLGVKKLPEDHFCVFKSVTRFASVDYNEALVALGYLATKKTAYGDRLVKTSRKVQQHLCQGSEFQQKIENLILVNTQPFGIPQGSPVSDVIANLYLLEFDKALRAIADNAGGFYYRYSDDILLLMPTASEDHTLRLQEIQMLIAKQGSELKIQDKKCSIYRFSKVSTIPTAQSSCKLIFGSQGKNGLEYLGFRFDGRAVYLRDKTIGGLNRKIVSSARRQAYIHVSKRPQMDLAQLRACFDYNSLVERFGKVKQFEVYKGTHSKWTFFTYVKRSSAILGTLGNPISKQMARHRAFIRRKADEALAQIWKP